jgi:hypothetical protein
MTRPMTRPMNRPMTRPTVLLTGTATLTAIAGTVLTGTLLTGPTVRTRLPHHRGHPGAELAAALGDRRGDHARSAGRGACGGGEPPAAREDPAKTGPRHRPRAAARGGEHEQRHRGDGGTGQQRYRRVQPHDGQGDPPGGPHPVQAEREEQARQRQRGPEAPARLLPEAAYHRLALASGQSRQKVHRDPVRVMFRAAVQSG